PPASFVKWTPSRVMVFAERLMFTNGGLQASRSAGIRSAQVLGRHASGACAAFASSGGGKVLIGVRNNGDLVGLSNHDAAERDAHVRRARGIIAQVRPTVKVTYRLCEEDGKLVLCSRIGRAGTDSGASAR